MSVEAEIVAHRERIATLRERMAKQEEFTGQLLGEVGDVKAKVNHISNNVDKLLEQYWNEHPSKAHNLPLNSSPPSARHKWNQESRLAALVGVIVILSHVISELVKLALHAK